MSLGSTPSLNRFRGIVRNDAHSISIRKHPEYIDAKRGDINAAVALAEKQLKPTTLSRLNKMIAGVPLSVVPIFNEGKADGNKLPLATAMVVCKRLGLRLDTSIQQVSSVGRTHATDSERMSLAPVFEGSIQNANSILLIDDAIRMGRTIANATRFAECCGGRVIGALALVCHRDKMAIAVTPNTYAALVQKFGYEVSTLIRSLAIDRRWALTETESKHLMSYRHIDDVRAVLGV